MCDEKMEVLSKTEVVYFGNYVDMYVLYAIFASGNLEGDSSVIFISAVFFTADGKLYCYF